MHAEASKLHTDSVEALEAKEKQNNYSQIPFKTYVNTKDFVKTNHYCKIFNWLLDFSLKQPPWSL